MLSLHTGVPVAVGLGVPVGVGLGVPVGVGPPELTGTQAENSDVLPVESVAVAVTACPPSTLT
jgi:hypothetical protein